MPAKRRQSLVDYAATEVIERNPCWMCHIPERVEVEEAVLLRGVTKRAALRWLQTKCGYGDEATENKIDRHFTKHVNV